MKTSINWEISKYNLQNSVEGKTEYNILYNI